MFLPINKQDLIERGIDRLDFIYVSGDAYVDHPSFGHAIITRMIEARGYTVGVIAQPVTDDDYKALGEPRIAFMVGSGVVDSMVNNYTVARRRRTDDDYSEGGKAGRRPDRALTVYSKALKRLYPKSCVIVGGIEASLRRLSHYDYWSDTVMHSVLYDCGADLLMYGMGEKPLTELLDFCDRNIPLSKVKSVRGTAYLTDLAHASRDVKDAIASNGSANYTLLPSHASVSSDKKAYAKAFMLTTQNVDPIGSKAIIQKQDNETYLVQNLPQFPLTAKEMDAVYALPYERRPHPSYTLGVPAIEEVEFSITSHRGCFGNCAFCALTYHQGKRIQHRTEQSIVEEAKLLTSNPNFKGYIHDVGGPSANFRSPSCLKQEKFGMCPNQECIGTKACKNLIVDHKDYLSILRSVRKLPGIKKVFIRSGVRFDYLMLDKDKTFFRELVKHHISGQLKVAPEHACDSVLKVMNKPPHSVYEAFCKEFYSTTASCGLNQYLVPYLISSHPGCTVNHAVKLAEYLHSIHYMPKQVQDFYPTPSTLATTMYYTELDPKTGESIFVAKDDESKAMQRALLQYRLKINHRLVRKALRLAGRTDLIGTAPNCLVPPESVSEKPQRFNSTGGGKTASKTAGKGRTKNGGKPKQAAANTGRANSNRKATNSKSAPHTPFKSKKNPQQGAKNNKKH